MGLFDFFKKKKTDDLDEQIRQAQENLARTQAQISAGQQPDPLPGQDMESLQKAMSILGIQSIKVDTSPEGVSALIAATGNLDSVTLTQKNQPQKSIVSYGEIQVNGVTLYKCLSDDRSPMLFEQPCVNYSLDWSCFVDTASCYCDTYGEDFYGDDLSEIIDEVVGQEEFTEYQTWIYGLAEDKSAVLYCPQEKKYVHFDWQKLARLLYLEEEL